MTEQDRYIPGVPCWIDTTQPDPEAAVAFYSGLFGWELEDAMPPDAPGRYFMARLPDGDVGAISSSPEAAAPTATWNSYVWVEDADATTERVRAAGGSVLMEPAEINDAGRMATVADREGATFSLWQPRRHRGAAVVNTHGSLNFNVLTTRDLDAASAFYGAVFGWEPLPVGDGHAWALAGYGDFLEQRNPGMRQGMKEMGAPARFEDVVAGLEVIGPDRPDVAPHWGVTFAVDDADAIAARAVELGGRVIAPPFDAPWVRMATVADPQGATFTVSKFVPENKDLPTTAGASSAA